MTIIYRIYCYLLLCKQCVIHTHVYSSKYCSCGRLCTEIVPRVKMIIICLLFRYMGCFTLYCLYIHTYSAYIHEVRYKEYICTYIHTHSIYMCKYIHVVCQHICIYSVQIHIDFLQAHTCIYAHT